MRINTKALIQDQETIAQRVTLRNTFPSLSDIQTVAGADLSCSRFSKMGYAAVLLFRYPDLTLLEEACETRELNFPYIPGFLAYREGPLIETCLSRLSKKPDVLICDGQGIAHPRRSGIASHVGVHMNITTVGCGKTLLVGEFDSLANERGAVSDLLHHEEKIGEALRTRTGVKPLFISPGHRIDFSQATALILDLCRRYRLPEPIRFAHKRVNELRKAPATDAPHET